MHTIACNPVFPLELDSAERLGSSLDIPSFLGERVKGFRELPASAGPIMVVDSDVGQREFLKALLARGGWRVETHASGEQALAAATRVRPLLVLLEVRLDGMSGYEVFRQLKDRHGDELAVIFISHDRTDPTDVEAGLMLGADDYLAKPLQGSELLARVIAVLRRVPAEPSDERESRRDRGDLTARELEVLQLLARGLDQRAIAQRLVIAPKTVGKHIEHILEKLPAKSRAEAVAIAYRRRLCTPPGDVVTLGQDH
jgi:DNA-binding NarL/FixJ family response regulator